MSFTDLALGAYVKLHAAFDTAKDRPLAELLGYDYPRSHRTRASRPCEFMYDIQESDFTREPVNAFNKYTFCLNRLALWEEVLRDYKEDDVNELRFEFTELPLNYCLHAPYSFRGRLTFCATQLCYTIGLVDRLITNDEVIADDKIYFSALKKVARHWPTARPLVDSLRGIADDRYQAATSNYRHKAQHRHPPRLDLGYTANVVRSFQSGMVSYTFGETPPLSTSDLLPVLADQANLMRAGFLAYRALVDEQRAQGQGADRDGRE